MEILKSPSGNFCKKFVPKIWSVYKHCKFSTPCLPVKMAVKTVRRPFYYMASSASGQYAANSVFWLATRAGKLERYRPPRDYPFRSPQIKFRQSSSGCTKVFFRKIFSVTVKRIFCDLFVRMELENDKTETRHHFSIQLASFSVLENKQVRRSFFQCFLCHIINLLLTKLIRSRWLDIGLVLFLRFYGPRPRLGP